MLNLCILVLVYHHSLQLT